MALAVLEYEGRNGDQLRFRADLGTNPYYAYAIGDGEPLSTSGIRRLAAASYTSAVAGPLPPAARGRTFIDVPARLFDRKNHFIQLTTFRSPERVGPAISDIVDLPLGETLADDDMLPAVLPHNPETPPMQTPLVSRSSKVRPHPLATRALSVPFAYEERQPRDTAMFLDGLGSLLGNLVPSIARVLPVVDDIGGAIAKVVGGGGGSSPPAAANAGSGPSDVARIVSALLPLLIGNKAGNPTSAAKPAPAPASDAGAALAESWSRSASTSSKPWPRSGYAHAQVVPLADPNFWKAAMESFVKLADLAVKNDQNLRDWIKQLNPGVDDAGLDALIKDMAAVAMDPQGDVAFRKVDAVRLAFEGLTPLQVGGRARVFFKRNQDITFHVTVDTPRPIPRAMLLFAIKDPETRALVVKKGYRLERIGSGAISPAPTVPRALLEPLQLGKEYVLCASLIWRSAKGDRIGVSAAQPFALCKEYVFETLAEPGKEVVRLSDVEQHRDFWHKAWQETFTEEVKSYDFDVKYYFALDPEKGQNARMETLVKTDHSGMWGERGRLKSGLILSLPELNSLLPSIAKLPVLDDKQLDALRAPEFVERYHRALRTKASLRGRPGDSVALWFYPEVALAKVGLKRATGTDASGQISGFEDVTVTFPIPVSAHVIGVSSQ